MDEAADDHERMSREATREGTDLWLAAAAFAAEHVSSSEVQPRGLDGEDLEHDDERGAPHLECQ